MIIKEYLFKTLLSPHISEKSSLSKDNHNIIVFKVKITSIKFDIKEAVERLLEVKVKKVSTLIVKGKRKRNKNKISFGKKWKKAYVKLEKSESLDLIGNSNK